MLWRKPCAEEVTGILENSSWWWPHGTSKMSRWHGKRGRKSEAVENSNLQRPIFSNRCSCRQSVLKQPGKVISWVIVSTSTPCHNTAVNENRIASDNDMKIESEFSPPSLILVAILCCTSFPCCVINGLGARSSWRYVWVVWATVSCTVIPASVFQVCCIGGSLMRSFELMSQTFICLVTIRCLQCICGSSHWSHQSSNASRNCFTSFLGYNGTSQSSNTGQGIHYVDFRNVAPHFCTRRCTGALQGRSSPVTSRNSSLCRKLLELWLC